MRTIVYIDGYNLYYNLLTKSPYKWLDLKYLFERHLLTKILLSNQQTPVQFDLIKLKYFTAPILARFASDPQSENRQAHYHRALKAHCADKVDIIHGFHLPAITTDTPVESIQGIDCLKVKVMEEKQTDVNIALHMYRDAAQGQCESIVLCSNDSDLEPALKMIATDFPNITRGLALPVKAKTGRKSGKLVKQADWVRHHIKDDELEMSQMPEIMLDRRKRTIRKPDKW